MSYCKKCDPMIGRTASLIHCDKCGILTCTNCSLDTCAVCDLSVCRRARCVAYVCDGSRYGSCGNIICTDAGCSKSAECPECSQMFCGECKPNHLPCRPITCSCGALVYREYEPRSRTCHDILPQTMAADATAQISARTPACAPVRFPSFTLTYPVRQCPMCPKTSCGCCTHTGARHRAAHFIIPFIIANDRGDLPYELPLEIIRAIWIFLLD